MKVGSRASLGALLGVLLAGGGPILLLLVRVPRSQLEGWLPFLLTLVALAALWGALVAVGLGPRRGTEALSRAAPGDPDAARLLGATGAAVAAAGGCVLGFIFVFVLGGVLITALVGADGSTAQAEILIVPVALVAAVLGALLAADLALDPPAISARRPPAQTPAPSARTRGHR